MGQELGRIDICVNNAGIINWQPLLESDIEDFDRIMATNVRADVRRVAGNIAAFMRSGGQGGRIVNTGSVLRGIGPRQAARLLLVRSRRSSA